MLYVLRARGPLKVTVARRHSMNLGREHAPLMDAHVNQATSSNMSFHIDGV